jgi:Domain of unknown function (DUF4440)
MKKLLLHSGIIIFIIAGAFTNTACGQEKYIYKPDDQKLYDAIVQLDSVFFAAYNNCTLQLDKYAAFYSDSLEFYHDKGGLSTSKQDVVEGTKKNICGKVTRELVKGSVEVYPIPGYGAVEMGLHMFHNNQEKQTGPPKVSKFIIFWQQINKEWKITKVVSLH